MISNITLARAFFACLHDMNIERVCFDGDGNLCQINGCYGCIHEDDCRLFTYDAQDPDSAEYFADEFLR